MEECSNSLICELEKKYNFQRFIFFFFVQCSVSSYSDLDYEVWSDALHTTKLQQSLTLQL